MITVKKSTLSVICGLCSLTLASPALMASTTAALSSSPPLSGFYLGGFGGWGASNDFEVTQSGVAFFSPHTFRTPPFNSSLDAPLGISAEGDSDGESMGFGGIHLGYEWLMPMYKDTTWTLTPAIELEGIYFSDNTEADDLDNSNIVLNPHIFDDEFSMKTGVVLVNGIVSLNCLRMNMLHPYIGVGLGAAVISINDADSTQVSPAEPGVNHFNSDEDGLDWTFAAQAKAGLRYVLSEHWRVFAEYRFLYLGDTDFTFGPTEYPTHVQTTSWDVDFDNMYFNAGALGIEWTL